VRRILFWNPLPKILNIEDIILLKFSRVERKRVWSTLLAASPIQAPQLSCFSKSQTHAAGADWSTLVYTAYCIWSVISPISKLNRLSSPLRLFGHVPLKRDQ